MFSERPLSLLTLHSRIWRRIRVDLGPQVILPSPPHGLVDDLLGPRPSDVPVLSSLGEGTSLNKAIPEHRNLSFGFARCKERIQDLLSIEVVDQFLDGIDRIGHIIHHQVDTLSPWTLPPHRRFERHGHEVRVMALAVPPVAANKGVPLNGLLDEGDCIGGERKPAFRLKSLNCLRKTAHSSSKGILVALHPHESIDDEPHKALVFLNRLGIICREAICRACWCVTHFAPFACRAAARRSAAASRCSGVMGARGLVNFTRCWRKESRRASPCSLPILWRTSSR